MELIYGIQLICKFIELVLELLSESLFELFDEVPAAVIQPPVPEPLTQLIRVYNPAYKGL